MDAEIPTGHERVELCGGPLDGLVTSVPTHVIECHKSKDYESGEWYVYVRTQRVNGGGNPTFVYVGVR
jgi:hypothetical protein